MAAYVAASCLALLAVAHSILGEREILGPLFAESWERPAPRWAMERILRFAWHLTSLAWVALGAAVLGAPVAGAVGVLGLVSGFVVFASLRGHLAWPLFLLAGAAGLSQAGWLPRGGLLVVMAAGLLVALGAAALHVYWAFGGRWGKAAAIPTKADGEPAFRPGPLLTAAVAGALLVLAGLQGWVASGAAPNVARALTWCAVAVLALRAVGDGKSVGFTKSSHATAFERSDDQLFTPLVVLLAFGAAAALAL